MKVKLISPIFDKENELKRCKVGAVLDVTDERGKRLINRKLAVEVKESKTAEKKTKKSS